MGRMRNNYCEEMGMKGDIRDFHEIALQNMGIPEWANIKCPDCKRDLPLRSIRQIGLCLNTRNLGDVFVEIFCEDCAMMDTHYFRSEAAVVNDFIQLLAGSRKPVSESIIEEDMYKSQYNNLIEKMAGGSNMTLIKRAVCSSNVIVSSSVCACSSCGHTEIVTGDVQPGMTCPKCDSPMDIIQSQASSDSNLIVPFETEEDEETNTND